MRARGRELFHRGVADTRVAVRHSRGLRPVVIVQLAEGVDGEATLASINEAVAASFPGASVTVEREYRNALRGYALRVPAGSLEAIRAVSGVQAAYPDGNNSLQ